MEFIYNVPDDLKHYDEVFKDWNEMVNMNIEEDTQTVVKNIVEWWELYPQKENKKQMVDLDNAPIKVWDIFDKFKITPTEKAFGIFYTLEYILGDEIDLEISSIQFNDDGHVDIAVLLDDVIICDNNYHEYNTMNVTVLNRFHTTIKA